MAGYAFKKRRSEIQVATVIRQNLWGAKLGKIFGKIWRRSANRSISGVSISSFSTINLYCLEAWLSPTNDSLAIFSGTRGQSASNCEAGFPRGVSPLANLVQGSASDGTQEMSISSSKFIESNWDYSILC